MHTEAVRPSLTVGRVKKRINWKQNLEAYAYFAPAMIVLAFVFIYPIIQMLRMSVMDDTATGERIFVGLRNYGMLVTDPIFWICLKNNVLLFLCIPVLLTLSHGVQPQELSM